MKKILSVILVLCLAAAMLVACGDKPDNAGETKEVDYTLGIGAAVTNDDFKVTTTVASVVLDADGKVVICRLDAVDVKPAVDAESGALTIEAAYATKREQGDNYKMVTYGGAKAEWYKQAEYFETAVVGKTADEIGAVKTGDAELTAGCTIDVTDFVKATVAACKSEHKVAFKTAAELTVGLSVIAGAEDKEDSVKYTADAAVAVVADGKVIAAVIDSLEATVELNDEGNVSSFSYKGTKLEQGDNYGMVAYGGASAEWYVQAQNFANTAVGKAPADVAGLATEGVAGCTIGVEGYHKALVKAAEGVR